MGRLRREIARLRGHAGGRTIALVDGTRYRYSQEETARELFQHTMEYLRSELEGGPRPAPPRIMEAVARAKNRRAALTQIYPSWGTSTPSTAFDLTTLVEEGRLRYLPLPPDPVASTDVVPVARPRGAR